MPLFFCMLHFKMKCRFQTLWYFCHSFCKDFASALPNLLVPVFIVFSLKAAYPKISPSGYLNLVTKNNHWYKWSLKILTYRIFPGNHSRVIITYQKTETEITLFKPKHLFIFLLLGLIWSSSFMWIKISLREIGPISLVAYRVLFGLIFGVVVISLRHVKLPRDFRTWISPLVPGITNFATPFFLISWSERSVDSSVAAILDCPPVYGRHRLRRHLYNVILSHSRNRSDAHKYG